MSYRVRQKVRHFSCSKYLHNLCITMNDQRVCILKI
nr:MAG TPA: hypothetical protein [Caudoviricetes sp.]